MKIVSWFEVGGNIQPMNQTMTRGKSESTLNHKEILFFPTDNEHRSETCVVWVSECLKFGYCSLVSKNPKPTKD